MSSEKEEASMALKLQNTLEIVFKQVYEIREYKKLNHNADLHVGRAGLTSTRGTPYSVIVKHIPFKTGQHPGLENEKLVYRFLMCFKERFPFFPKLLGITDDALILEDLGEGVVKGVKGSAAQRSFLQTLASLHAFSSGKNVIYERLKATFALPHGKMQPLYRRNTFFNQGCAYARKCLNLLGISDQSLDHALALTKAALNNPGHFFSLVHNDLVCSQQCIVKNKQLYLIDFEYSRYAHALLDFWHLYIGRIERNTAEGTYGISKLNYTRGAELWYRQAFERSFRRSLEKEEWEKHSGGVLIYCVMVMLGKLINMPGYIKKYGLHLAPRSNYSKELRDLLSCLLLPLESNGLFPGLRQMVERWLEKLKILTALNRGIFPEVAGDE